MWGEGDVIVRREVLNTGHCWLENPVRVVQDTPGLLVTYLAEETEFTFPPSPLPHPWGRRKQWEGHGVLMLQRPGEMHSIWVFWNGPQREFAGWYVNIQEPFRRMERGVDTQDLELDIWIPAGGRWQWKDNELRVANLLDNGRPWWDPAWAGWSP